jgi:nucleoside-diphosphate-sugar epimerase
MNVVIIGGSGHVGTYLVPRLVEAGHRVTNISRGDSQPYLPHKAWDSVQQVQIDRKQAEADGTFGQQILALKPDIVIDMICFTLESCQHLVEAVRGNVQHFLHCGTVWIHGHTTIAPVTEDQPRRPFGEYGIQKSAIADYLLQETRLNNFPATALHPGHIVGPGHKPVGPTGNNDLRVIEKLARGEKVALPNFGLETVHHVHADDVAQAFMKAIANWSMAVGEGFHTVSPAAITLRGFCEAVAAWFGQEANLEFLAWDEWCKTVDPDMANMTHDHIAHSPNASIEKARRLLSYQPRYTSLEAVFESLTWLIDNGQIRVDAF